MGRQKDRRTPRAAPAESRPPLMHALRDDLLHLQACDERPWNYLPLVLVLAFAARAAVALSGDFVLHPDEIMQYLEPAHRLVFDSGVTYWEFFYGARAWLVPGAVAAVLKLFDAVGMDQPFWYVGGVKLVFCAISLLIPAGMYVFARRHFGETTARAALVAGTFWYELAGFAHKPMTEFVATVPLLALLALCVRPTVDDARTIWLAAFLAVITVAIRMQYGPLALVLLGIVFLRTGKKIQLAVAAAGFFFVVGIFDAVTWDAGLFHSYLTNLRFNLALGPMRADESPVWQYLFWLALAGSGLSVLSLVAALCLPRRYGFLLALIALLLLIHSLQEHKEYRFIFVAVPLWLLIGADLVTRFVTRGDGARRMAGWAAAVFVVVSLAGILNALPYQQRIYQAWSAETGATGFVRNQDPIFAAYRYLARAPGVAAVWQVDRPYYRLPGYYYLHRNIPFYDVFTGEGLKQNATQVPALVSHVVTADPNLSVPGYAVERMFGDVRILRREENERPIRQWQDYAPIITGDLDKRIMRQIDPEAPVPPVQAGIRFSDQSTLP